ncbi:hypothetical protein WUBG_17902, partial [Wuchereria bancrofti]
WDSDLEAFSHNPSDGSFAPLADGQAHEPAIPLVLSRITIATTYYTHVPYWWVNDPTLGEFCFVMIGRADIEGSKSNVAMNAWLPQASYPCGNFSDTSSKKFKSIDRPRFRGLYSYWKSRSSELLPFTLRE